MKQLLLCLCAALLGLGAAPPASAGILFFTDRPTWEAAAGPLGFSEDFEGFTSDTSFRTAPVALDGMSIQQVGSDTFRNEVDVSPYNFTEHGGSPHASLYTNHAGGSFPEIEVQIVFDAANAAFGFDHWAAADAEGARLEVYDGVTLLGFHDLSNGFPGFTGYVLDGGDSATSVIFSSVSSITGPGDPGEAYGIDNLAGVPVPEPGSFALLALGLAGLAWRGRS